MPDAWSLLEARRPRTGSIVVFGPSIGEAVDTRSLYGEGFDATQILFWRFASGLKAKIKRIYGVDFFAPGRGYVFFSPLLRS